MKALSVPPSFSSAPTSAGPCGNAARARPQSEKRAMVSGRCGIGLGILIVYVCVGLLSLFLTPYDPMLSGRRPRLRGAKPRVSGLAPIGSRYYAVSCAEWHPLRSGHRYRRCRDLARGRHLPWRCCRLLRRDRHHHAAHCRHLSGVPRPALCDARRSGRRFRHRQRHRRARLRRHLDYLRLACAEIRSRRDWQFSEAARLVGNRSWGIAFKHLLPNSIGPLLAFTSVNAAFSA